MVFSVYSCVSLLFVSRRPTTQKTFGPGRICNSKSGPAGFEKIISGATLILTIFYCTEINYWGLITLKHGDVGVLEVRLIESTHAHAHIHVTICNTRTFMFFHVWILIKRCVMIARYVKEQLIDDNAHPPCYDGQVVCWVWHTYIYTCSFYLFISHVLYYRDIENCELIIFIRFVRIFFGAVVGAVCLISIVN